MENINLNVLMIAGLAGLLLVVIVLVALPGFGGNTKGKKEKLEKYRGRFSPNKHEILAAQSIRRNAAGSDIQQRLLDLIPRKDKLANHLRKAGIKVPLFRFASFGVLVFFLAFIFIVIAGALPAFTAFTVSLFLAVAGPAFYVKRRIKKRLAQFTKLFPDAIDMIVRGLKSGLPVGECLNNVAREIDDPIRSEFSELTDLIRLGKQIEDALWETSERLDTPDFKFFVITLSIQRETGGNLAETLANLSSILRQRQAMKLKVKALSSEAKASAWIVGILPFIMFLLINLMNPDYGAVLYTDPRAIAAVIGGLIWMSIGVFIMAKMTNFEV